MGLCGNFNLIFQRVCLILGIFFTSKITSMNPYFTYDSSQQIKISIGILRTTSLKKKPRCHQQIKQNKVNLSTDQRTHAFWIWHWATLLQNLSITVTNKSCNARLTYNCSFDSDDLCSGQCLISTTNLFWTTPTQTIVLNHWQLNDSRENIGQKKILIQFMKNSFLAWTVINLGFRNFI